MRHHILLAFLFPAIANFYVHAEDAVYRGTDEKGNVIYSNTPQGLKNVKKIIVSEPSISGSTYAAPRTVVPPSGSVPPASGSVPPASGSVPPASGSVPPAVTPTQGASTPVSISVYSAEQRYRAAQQAAESGKEPLEGERVGTSGGSSRLTQSYFERQDKLARDLDAARQTLQGASLTK